MPASPPPPSRSAGSRLDRNHLRIFLSIDPSAEIQRDAPDRSRHIWLHAGGGSLTRDPTDQENVRSRRHPRTVCRLSSRLTLSSRQIGGDVKVQRGEPEKRENTACPQPVVGV